MRCQPWKPGEGFKNPKPPKKQKLDMGRKPRVEEPKHRRAIQQLPCLACGSMQGSDAAHVRMTDGPEKPNAGIGQKPADRFTVPLCTQCHLESGGQHTRGERVWWLSIGIDPLLHAAELYAHSPDTTKMTAYIIKFREGL